jgi:hypothetical protein
MARRGRDYNRLMDKWYHVATDELTDDALQKYGDDGWELVGFTPTLRAGQFLIVFKRPVAGQPAGPAKR